MYQRWPFLYFLLNHCHSVTFLSHASRGPHDRRQLLIAYCRPAPTANSNQHCTVCFFVRRVKKNSKTNIKAPRQSWAMGTTTCLRGAGCSEVWLCDGTYQCFYCPSVFFKIVLYLNHIGVWRGGTNVSVYFNIILHSHHIWVWGGCSCWNPMGRIFPADHRVDHWLGPSFPDFWGSVPCSPPCPQ